MCQYCFASRQLLVTQEHKVSPLLLIKIHFEALDNNDAEVKIKFLYNYLLRKQLSMKSSLKLLSSSVST